MTVIKKISLAIAILATLWSCNPSESNGSNLEISDPESEEAFETAGENWSKMKPQSAELSFEINGKKYELDPSTIEVSIIPFAMYKPLNEEESQAEESLIWLKGKNKSDGQAIFIEMVIPGKLTTGEFAATSGRIEAYPEFKYMDIKSLQINITSVVPFDFLPELKGYSMEMTFEGTAKEAGPSKPISEIKNGKYLIKY